MQVSDILRVKGGTLYTTAPDAPLREAIETMSRLDIGSLAVMNRGELAGMLTFREVIHTLAKSGCNVTTEQVSCVMDPHPTTCTPTNDINEIRPLMLERHTRYMPVMDGTMLMGVISFYDVARAVVESQNFENKMLKAYIRDWPEDTSKA